MPLNLPPRNERISRLKSFADGNRSKKATFARFGNAPSVSAAEKPDNLLFGIALRATSRKLKGQPLSSLEDAVLGLLDCISDDETELAEYGRIFDDAKRNGSTFQGIPAAILALPNDVAYTSEYCLRDGAAMMGKSDASLKVLVADTSTETGGSDNPDVADDNGEATVANATVFTAPESHQVSAFGGVDKSPRDMIVRLHKFECIEASGDGIFKTKDEITWKFVSGIMDHTERIGQSREYGSITSGKMTMFDTNTILYQGVIPECLCTHVQVFEMDDGHQKWHDTVRKILREVGSMLEKNADEMEWGHDELRVQAEVKLVAAICKFFDDFWDEIVNEHDFVAQETESWDKNWIMNQLANWNGAPTHAVRFDRHDGNGKHDLYFSFTKA